MKKVLNLGPDCLLSFDFTEHHTIPVASQYQGLFPAKLSSYLVTWQRSTYEDYTAVPYTKTIVELELAHENDLYFIAGMERGTGR